MKPYLLVALAVASGNAFAWPWGDKNYDECMASEMKGRPREQTQLAVRVCARRFPEFPEFKKKDYYGTLVCSTQQTTLEFRIGKDAVESDLGRFVVQSRSEDELRAAIPGYQWSPDKPKGTLTLVIDFLLGTAYLSDPVLIVSPESLGCRRK